MITGMNEETGKFIGKILDSKYEIESLIGAGATGNVYKGKHLLLNIPIAIKILHSSLIDNDTARKRFRQEARVATAILHDNAMSVMDFGIWEDEIYYLIMEYIDGVSLSDLLKQERKFEVERAVKIARQICLALDVAHQKNIIHRDLKPANIMIVKAGTAQELVKVIDFSIAKKTEDISNLTGKDTVLGTPQYISPEQVQGGVSLDNRSDIYSLGVILYEMLAGAPPFQAKTAAALFMQHVHANPTPLRKIDPTIPAALDDLVLQVLSKKVEQRPNSMALLATQLTAAISAPASVQEVQQKPAIVMPNPSPAPKPRMPFSAEPTSAELDTLSEPRPKQSSPPAAKSAQAIPMRANQENIEYHTPKDPMPAIKISPPTTNPNAQMREVAPTSQPKEKTGFWQWLLSFFKRA